MPAIQIGIRHCFHSARRQDCISTQHVLRGTSTLAGNALGLGWMVDVINDVSHLNSKLVLCALLIDITFSLFVPLLRMFRDFYSTLSPLYNRLCGQVDCIGTCMRLSTKSGAAARASTPSPRLYNSADQAGTIYLNP